MNLTYEEFENYLNQIRNRDFESKRRIVYLLTKVTNDNMGYINYFVFGSDFGNSSEAQTMFDKSGNIVEINNIEDLWKLLIQ